MSKLFSACVGKIVSNVEWSVTLVGLNERRFLHHRQSDRHIMNIIRTHMQLYTMSRSIVCRKKLISIYFGADIERVTLRRKKMWMGSAVRSAQLKCTIYSFFFIFIHNQTHNCTKTLMYLQLICVTLEYAWLVTLLFFCWHNLFISMLWIWTLSLQINFAISIERLREKTKQNKIKTKPKANRKRSENKCIWV